MTLGRLGWICLVAICATACSREEPDAQGQATAVQTAETASEQTSRAPAVPAPEPTAAPMVATAPPDSDSDGVPDDADRCPGSTGPVDDTGCRPRLTAPRTFDVRIVFAPGETTLEPTAARAALADVIALSRTYPDTQIAVHAYTDNSGPESLNLALSRDRAKAVAAVLRQEARLVGRVSSHGHGESYPLVSNATADGRARNRRIEVIVSPGD